MNPWKKSEPEQLESLNMTWRAFQGILRGFHQRAVGNRLGGAQSPTTDQRGEMWANVSSKDAHHKRGKPYQAGVNVQELKRIKIKKAITINFIEPAQTELAETIEFTLMNDGSLQFCINYCTLKTYTQRGYYPTPKIDEFID